MRSPTFMVARGLIHGNVHVLQEVLSRPLARIVIVKGAGDQPDGPGRDDEQKKRYPRRGLAHEPHELPDMPASPAGCWQPQPAGVRVVLHAEGWATAGRFLADGEGRPQIMASIYVLANKSSGASYQ